jgi:hypothetical protein
VKRNKRTFLELERLEDRWVPANVQFVSGFLIIGPSSGETAMKLTVKQSSANHFTVTDGASTLGTFGPVGNLLINGSNGADSITVDLNGLTYTGNIPSISTANGNDSVSIMNGKVAGNLAVLLGPGNDSVSLSANVGGTAQVISQSGAGSASVTVTSTSIGGDLSLTSIRRVTLSAATAFGGNVTVQDGAIASSSVTISGAATVNKNLTIQGGTGSDSVAISGALTVNGGTQITLGNGNDTFNLTSASTFGGNFGFTSGAGNDSVLVMGAAVFGGQTTSFNMGDGNDSVTLMSTSSVFGTLSMTEGSGNDSVTVDSTVFGDMRWNLGNGTDTVTIGNAPGGTLFWTSGNGNDSVTFGDGTNSAGETWTVNMRFGTGNDTLTLAGNGTVASPENLTGFIDMGGPPGGNSFDPTGSLAAGTWQTVSPFTLQNV